MEKYCNLTDGWLTASHADTGRHRRHVGRVLLAHGPSQRLLPADAVPWLPALDVDERGLQPLPRRRPAVLGHRTRALAAGPAGACENDLTTGPCCCVRLPAHGVDAHSVRGWARRRACTR
jgi:hypothetical protein